MGGDVGQRERRPVPGLQRGRRAGRACAVTSAAHGVDGIQQPRRQAREKSTGDLLPLGGGKFQMPNKTDLHFLYQVCECSFVQHVRINGANWFEAAITFEVDGCD